jgi:glycosyltransferase involved in cell wall biosynthesis
MAKHISIFFYEGYIGVSPTVINLTKVFDSYGYLVSIYATKNGYPEPGEIGEKVEIFYFNKHHKFIDWFQQSHLKIFAKLKGLVPLFKVEIFSFQALTRNLAFRAKPTINIGIDIYGSAAALINFYIFKQKFLFLSLELKEKPEDYKGLAILLKNLAYWAYQKSECVIVQDEERFEVLCENYKYRHPKVFYLPNSTFALDEQNLCLDSTNFFREKFNLSQEKFPYIILQAGMINKTVCAKPLAEAFASLDNGYALIFHERAARQATDPYIELLRQVNSKNLFLSLEPLPYEQIDRIYASSTIGLVFYQPSKDTNDNFLKIAKASGKLPQYLKHGKPILVSDLSSLANLVEQYQCGLVIKDPSNSKEINLAIEQILSNYDTYSSKAKACFKAEFDFGKKMEPILNYIKTL